jgi:hypothetical protein
MLSARAAFTARQSVPPIDGRDRLRIPTCIEVTWAAYLASSIRNRKRCRLG